MKIEIIEKGRERKIPGVGQLWRHVGSTCVLMRMNDSHGARALGFSVKPKETFFSIDMEDGEVCFTEKATTNIEILELVDGVLRVAVVD